MGGLHTGSATGAAEQVGGVGAGLLAGRGRQGWAGWGPEGSDAGGGAFCPTLMGRCQSGRGLGGGTPSAPPHVDLSPPGPQHPRGLKARPSPSSPGPGDLWSASRPGSAPPPAWGCAPRPSPCSSPPVLPPTRSPTSSRRLRRPRPAKWPFRGAGQAVRRTDGRGTGGGLTARGLRSGQRSSVMAPPRLAGQPSSRRRATTPRTPRAAGWLRGAGRSAPRVAARGTD